MLANGRECSVLDQPVVQVGPIDDLLDGALAAWRTNRDSRALRRALLRVLGELEEHA
jgi:hypothetical protein